ncbi:MAG: terpene cyclase/mutase family protein [Planctomycetes bacterium]|nr:terpene cyclase/mutase family protein [Planctomycetota bacterium]
MRFRSRLAAFTCLGLATVFTAVLASGAAAQTPPEDPAKDLDPRIAPEKIGPAAPAPPLPERVLLPLPPAHRIAEHPRQVPIDEEHWDRAIRALRGGIEYLLADQDARGVWMRHVGARPTRTGPGAANPKAAGATPSAGAPDVVTATEPPSPVSLAVTALAVKALIQADAGAIETPAVRRGLRCILDAAGSDGAFGSGAMTNYVTATVVSALSNVDEFRDTERLQASVRWLQRAQWDDTEGVSPNQDWYGGAGYGRRGRPDLSNTQMTLEALYDAGLSPSEPAFQRALTFLSRTQNLRSTNAAAWASNDGGFVYTPAGNGESMASEYAGEGRYGEQMPEGSPRSLRSYGSMTYAGFKSMLYAGLSPDDERVRAAYEWIRRHWTFEENPGLGGQGLYYYYHSMARALRVGQQHAVIDTDGARHNWREELIDALVTRQQSDGSWVNHEERWLEGEPALVTAYALLALEEALKPVHAVAEVPE